MLAGSLRPGHGLRQTGHYGRRLTAEAGIVGTRTEGYEQPGDGQMKPNMKIFDIYSPKGDIK